MPVNEKGQEKIASCYNFMQMGDYVTTSGVVPGRILKSLADQGYDVVINLLPEDDEYAIASEKEIIESQDITYIHIPVDFNDPQIADVEDFIEVMDQFHGQKIHVHCAANWRVSAFYGLYCVRKGAWKAAEAVKFMTSIWSPGDYPAWIELLRHYSIEI